MSESEPDFRRALRAVCDTVFPAVERADDPDGFWGRRASDLGVELGVEFVLEAQVPEPDRTALKEMLGFLDLQEFHTYPQEAREAVLTGLAESSPEGAAAVRFFQQVTLLLAYGMVDAEGGNPNWKILEYPGPLSPPPAVPKTIPMLPVAGDRLDLEADVVVVGSGAGGAVVAATLAEHGRDVVVLDAGGYFNESDFNQQELWAYASLYWRGGPTPSADGNITLLAGATLGGGTTVNWMNCVRTAPWVREQWARDHGLEGVDGPEFDAHMDAVLDRIRANAECSDFNGPHRRMQEACERLGYSFRTIVRNADPEKYEYRSAGYVGFGDQSGSKQGTVPTFLQDAAGRGARVLDRTRVARVLVEGGRAAGVEGTHTAADGRTVPVTVRARQVVVAAGALESPALLLRSGIGGPAAGRHLRLHPVGAVNGRYAERQEAYFGAPQASLCNQFQDWEDGYGFLVECAQYGPGLAGSATPWLSGEDHKEQMTKVPFGATFIGVCRDHGSGTVTVDAAGEAVVSYPLDDELDRRVFHKSLEEMIRMHEAAGAEEILVVHPGAPSWQRGQDLEAFIAAARELEIGAPAGGCAVFTAHQTGSCRMGTDPSDSVARPTGELHDTPGVWIGDGSAFPTAAGTNPMVTIMALARRTALAMLEADPAG